MPPFVVLGQVLPIAEPFPGETGALGFKRLCPPMDLGDGYRCLSVPDVGYWDSVPNDGKGFPDLAHAPVAAVLREQIPKGLVPGVNTRIGRMVIWKHDPARTWFVLAEARGANGEHLVGVAFDGTIMRFMVGEHETELDCAFAAGTEGFVIVRWDRERVSITYYAVTATGEQMERGASSEQRN